MLWANFIEPKVLETGVIYIYDPKCNIAYPVNLLTLLQLANPALTQEDLDAVLDDYTECLV